MTIQKPADLVRFVSNVPVLSDGTIPINTLEALEPYVSPLYTPTFALTTLARLTQDDLSSDKIEVVNVELDPRTIVSLALRSDLASYAPDIYLLLRAIVLESFSLLYHIEVGSENLRYVSEKDILRVKENINYVADYFGTEEKYHNMIEVLRAMNISFGYLQHQIEVIMNGRGVR